VPDPDSIDGYVLTEQPDALEVHRCVKLPRDLFPLLLAVLFRKPVPPVFTVVRGPDQPRGAVSINDIATVRAVGASDAGESAVAFFSPDDRVMSPLLAFDSGVAASRFVAEVAPHLERLRSAAA